MFGRESALWLAVAISVLAFAVPAVSGAADDLPCNGSPLLCGKTLDQVVLPGTHNSMSNEEYGWGIPNQHYSIPTQLSMGIRAFLIDTHYGKPQGTAGQVVNWDDSTDGDPSANGAGLYLCHEFCQIGASELTSELTKVADFLADHPREVLVFVNEDYISPADFAKAVTDSGLLDYVYTGSTDRYPTLGQMIADDQRVVMLAEGHYGNASDYQVPWYHRAYDGPMQETPYNFLNDEDGTALTPGQGMDQLTGPDTVDSTCRANRGGSTGALFLMNHWVNGFIDSTLAGGGNVIPDPAVAQVLNQPDVLVDRARACERVRGELPNIVAVDDFGDGDLIAAVNQLNGIPEPGPDPGPDPDPGHGPDPIDVRISVKKPKAARVAAGRKAVFKVTVKNAGANATPARLCVSVPKRLARQPRCLRFKLGSSERITMKVKVPTKPRAGGRGTIKFVLTASGKTASNRSSLIVKPKRKTHRHKHR